MIAVETMNILSTNRVACGTGINFRHFSGEMPAFSHLKNTKKMMPKISTNFIYSHVYTGRNMSIEIDHRKASR